MQYDNGREGGPETKVEIRAGEGKGRRCGGTGHRQRGGGTLRPPFGRVWHSEWDS